MHFLSLIATAAFLSTSASAANIPSPRVEAREAYSRSNVDNCEAALRWHKASVFCSSFAHIKDVKTTVYKNAPTTMVTTTKTAACTTRPKSYAYAKREASADAYYGHQQQCNRQGLPTYAQKYCCEDISKACRRYVKPKTTTITISKKQCTSTQTRWITPACTTTTTEKSSSTTTTKLATTTSSAQTTSSRTTTATASSTSSKDTTQSTVKTTATTASTTQSTTTTSVSTSTTTTAPAGPTTGPTCPANQMACGSSCLDTSRDDNNCGGCGNKCEFSRKACVEGECSCTPDLQFNQVGNKFVPCCNGRPPTQGICTVL